MDSHRTKVILPHSQELSPIARILLMARDQEKRGLEWKLDQMVVFKAHRVPNVAPKMRGAKGGCSR